MLGGIETGGTKIVVALADRPDRILKRWSFATGSDPRAALRRCAAALSSSGALEAVGVGSFGPCDPDPGSPTYGTIGRTPKPGWAGFDLIGGLRTALARAFGGAAPPVALDTDVGAAVVGEHRHGAGRGARSLAYVTIGTGIGGAGIDSGRVVHGAAHPEMGHLLLPRATGELDGFTGTCPFHGDCWEGVASGPALQQRWGRSGRDLARDHPAWELEADYVATGLHAIACMLAPERIVLGGGVGLADGLIDRVRPKLRASLAGYLPIVAGTVDLVREAGLGPDAGVVGALCLAQDLSRDRTGPRGPGP